MISNSGHDERGKASGGQVGDQTGTEWQIRSWYNRPWDCILRHPDKNVRKMIAQFARSAANNNNIGYNQGDRLSFWKALTSSEYNPANIKTKCNSDCSAGVTAIVKAVGHILQLPKLEALSPTNYTGSMRASFRNAGFTVLIEDKYLTSDKYLIPALEAGRDNFGEFSSILEFLTFMLRLSYDSIAKYKNIDLPPVRGFYEQTYVE